MSVANTLLARGTGTLLSVAGEPVVYKYGGATTLSTTAAINHDGGQSIGVGIVPPNSKKPVRILLPQSMSTAPREGGFVTDAGSRTYRLTSVINTGVGYECEAEANA